MFFRAADGSGGAGSAAAADAASMTIVIQWHQNLSTSCVNEAFGAYMCDLCGVVLCSEPLKQGGKSCHDLWHQRQDLAALASTSRKRLLDHRENEDEDAKRRKDNAKKARLVRSTNS